MRLMLPSALAALVLTGLLAVACDRAHAQALNPTWEGEWVAVETTQGAAGNRMRIARDGQVTRLTSGDTSCQLAYDDMVTPQTLLRRLQDLRDWQLDASHWPRGTQPSQLIGLAREFDRAQAIVQGIGADNYRRVRATGTGCSDRENEEDVFLLLHRGQELYRFAFSQTVLGASVASFRRQKQTIPTQPRSAP